MKKLESLISKKLEEHRAKRSSNKGSSFSPGVDILRYHYEKPAIYSSIYGITYECNHPVYNKCTLFKIGNNGLAVIQQRYDQNTKRTWWSELNPWLPDHLYLHPRFKEVFEERSGECIHDLYPTITVRQLMWALKMKPLARERWETCFDRRDI